MLLKFSLVKILSKFSILRHFKKLNISLGALISSLLFAPDEMKGVKPFFKHVTITSLNFGKA